MINVDCRLCFQGTIRKDVVIQTSPFELEKYTQNQLEVSSTGMIKGKDKNGRSTSTCFTIDQGYEGFKLRTTFFSGMSACAPLQPDLYRAMDLITDSGAKQ